MIENIGIIGAGQMGRGIAKVCVLAGYNVILNDILEETLQKGLATIDYNLEKQVARNKISVQEKEEALRRLHADIGFEGFKKCDLVIEAIIEDEAIKKATFKKLSPYLSPQCILATNTSSISITVLGEATDRPDKFMGMHFMNPVSVMQLVELIRGMQTSNTTFNSVQEVVKRLGKQFTVSEDYPGFIVNRILMPMINEGVYALFEGVGNGIVLCCTALFCKKKNFKDNSVF